MLSQMWAYFVFLKAQEDALKCCVLSTVQKN